MRTSKVLLGILAGIAAGATLGVIFAPDKGSVTRRKLIRKGEDLHTLINDSVEEKFEELLETIADERRKSKTPDSARQSSHESKTL